MKTFEFTINLKVFKLLKTMKLQLVAFFLGLACVRAFWSPEPRNHTCCAWGDPHYKMYDGGWVHFQGACRYLLSGTCPCSALEAFHVYVENVPWNAAVSITNLVEIHYDDWVIQFNINDIVNVYPPGGPWDMNVGVPNFTAVGVITKPSWNHMVFDGNNGVRVEFSGNHRACVTTPCKYEDEMCGICGNMNNIMDDYVTSAGVNVTGWPNMYSMIGSSWQVYPPSWSTLGRRCYGNETVPDIDYTPHGDVDTSPCDCLRQYDECVAALPDLYEQYHAGCIYDMQAGATHCHAAAAFVAACEALLGIDYSHWREICNCPCLDGSMNDPCPGPYVISETTPTEVQDYTTHGDVDTSPCDCLRQYDDCVAALPDLYEQYHACCVNEMQAGGTHCHAAAAFVAACEHLLGINYSHWREICNCPCLDGSMNDPCRETYMTSQFGRTEDLENTHHGDSNISPCDCLRRYRECVAALPDLYEQYHACCVYEMQAGGTHCHAAAAFVAACEHLLGIDYSHWREICNCPCRDGSMNDPCPGPYAISESERTVFQDIRG